MQLITATEQRIRHPEDLIYEKGSKGAQQALNALLRLIEAAPKTTTVKWDGSPAVFFGVDHNGKFILTDKSGFTAKSYKGRAESPEELEQMFLGRLSKRKKNQTQEQQEEYSKLAADMKSIFEVLRGAMKSVKKGMFFKGDLLYMETPEVKDGSYVFQPNVVEYRVPVSSELGSYVGNSRVGIVVHAVLSEDGNGRLLEEPVGNNLEDYFKGERFADGLRSGELLVFSPVHVHSRAKFTPEMITELESTQTVVEGSSRLIDALLDQERLVGHGIVDLPEMMHRYSNSMVSDFSAISVRGFVQWLSTASLSHRKKSRMLSYVQRSNKAVEITFEVLKKLERLKNQIIDQFDRQQAGFEVQSFIDGEPGGEGYVTIDPELGPFKLVNRSKFTAINRAVIREQKDVAVKIGWYPGSFKPLHRGHYKSILRAAGMVDRLHVLVSLQDRIRPNEFPISGQAAKQYIETYIMPSLPSNVEFSFIDGSPVTYLLRTVPVNSVVFAGEEELREYTPAFRKYAPDSKVQMVSLPEVSREGTPGGERVFGGGVRAYIQSGDVAGLASVLPDIPEVQSHIPQIMNLFQTTGRELMNKKQHVKKNQDELVQEMISLLVVEEILLTEAKRKKGKFPKKYEPLIMKLKKRYGDPTKMDSGPEKKKAGALVFGTVQNILKRKKKA